MKQFFINLTIVLTMALTFSCKKKATENVTPQTEQKTKLDKTEVLPGDVIIITTPTEITKEEWTITLGGKSIKLNKFDANTALLPIAYLPTGSYQINLPDLGIDNTTIKVLPYTAVTNPQPIINEFGTRIQKGIIDAQSTSNQEAATLITSLQQTFDTEYAKLNAAEQKETAFILDRLNKQLDEMDKQVKNTTSYHSATELAPIEKTITNKATSLNTFPESATVLNTVDGDVFVKRALKFTIKISGGVILATGASHLLYVPEFSSKILAIGSTALAVTAFVSAFDDMKILYDLIFKHENFKITGENGNLFSTKNNQQVTLANNVTSSSTLNFSKNKPQISLAVQSNYASFSMAFKNQQHSSYQSVFESVEKLQNAYKSIATKVNAIKSLFSKTPAMPAYAITIPASSKIAENVTPFAKLSVANISDSNIQIALSQDNGKIAFKVTSTLTTQKDFTFDLVYTDNAINLKNKKTINASYDGEIPKTEGTWDLIASRMDGKYNTHKIGELYLIFKGNKCEEYENNKISRTGTFITTDSSIIVTWSNGARDTANLRWNSINEIVLSTTDVEQTFKKR